MGGKHSRTKGHAFERFVAQELRSVFPKARRNLEYHQDDCYGVDLIETGRYLIQCKKLKRYASINAIKEIKGIKSGEVPVLITAGDKQEPMAVLPLSELIRLLLQGGVQEEPDLDELLPALKQPI